MEGILLNNGDDPAAEVNGSDRLEGILSRVEAKVTKPEDIKYNILMSSYLKGMTENQGEVSGLKALATYSRVKHLHRGSTKAGLIDTCNPKVMPSSMKKHVGRVFGGIAVKPEGLGFIGPEASWHTYKSELESSFVSSERVRETSYNCREVRVLTFKEEVVQGRGAISSRQYHSSIKSRAKNILNASVKQRNVDDIDMVEASGASGVGKGSMSEARGCRIIKGDVRDTQGDALKSCGKRVRGQEIEEPSRRGNIKRRRAYSEPDVSEKQLLKIAPVLSKLEEMYPYRTPSTSSLPALLSSSPPLAPLTLPSQSTTSVPPMATSQDGWPPLNPPQVSVVPSPLSADDVTAMPTLQPHPPRLSSMQSSLSSPSSVSSDSSTSSSSFSEDSSVYSLPESSLFAEDETCTVKKRVLQSLIKSHQKTSDADGKFCMLMASKMRKLKSEGKKILLRMEIVQLVMDAEFENSRK